jgi:hypothetical protein
MNSMSLFPGAVAQQNTNNAGLVGGGEPTSGEGMVFGGVYDQAMSSDSNLQPIQELSGEHENSKGLSLEGESSLNLSQLNEKLGSKLEALAEKLSNLDELSLEELETLGFNLGEIESLLKGLNNFELSEMDLKDMKGFEEGITKLKGLLVSFVEAKLIEPAQVIDLDLGSGGFNKLEVYPIETSKIELKVPENNITETVKDLEKANGLNSEEMNRYPKTKRNNQFQRQSRMTLDQ